MMSVDFQQLVKQIAINDPAARTAARMIAFSLQEDAIDPLLDEYYAGVSDSEGAAILDVLARIGGPEALTALRSVFAFEEERPALKLASALGLLRNRMNLSDYEVDDIVLYLRDAYPDKY